MDTKRISKHVVEIKSVGRRQKLLMVTDAHYDSHYCDRKLLKKHLQEAKDEDAVIFFNGDLFDVMGCYKDPRSKSADVRPEYIRNDNSYLDLVITDVYEFLKPYAENIALMAYGNHETAILKHRDTDPLKRLVFLLNRHTKKDILLSGYKGVMKIKMGKNEGGTSDCFYIVHHHGYGGNAKRSKGVLKADLEQALYPFADIIFSGHTHQKWYVPLNAYRITQKEEIVLKKQYHLNGGSYKDTSDKSMGFEVEKGFNPTVSGGWWIDFHLRGDRRDKVITIREAQ